MAEFDPLVRPPSASDFTSTASGLGSMLGNLPTIFRQAQLQQAQVDAQNALRQAAQQGRLTLPDMLKAIAGAGDVTDVVKMAPFLPLGGTNLLSPDVAPQAAAGGGP